MSSETLVWWLMVQVVGLAALPLCLTLFRRLPDRGYALSKPFALLLVGYLFWILNVIILPNSLWSIWFVLALLFLASSRFLTRPLLGEQAGHVLSLGERSHLSPDGGQAVARRCRHRRRRRRYLLRPRPAVRSEALVR